MIKIHNKSGDITVAELIDENIIIGNAQDAVEFISDPQTDSCDRFIIYKKNLDSGFFDLKTGVAGDILQKFSNYRVKLAVVGDFTGYKSKNLQDFFRESNRSGRILFVETLEEALSRL